MEIDLHPKNNLYIQLNERKYIYIHSKIDDQIDINIDIDMDMDMDMDIDMDIRQYQI